MSHTADIDYLAEISTRQTPALTPTILGILRPAQSIQDFKGMSVFNLSDISLMGIKQ
jgi:hypothetical protein